MANPVTPIVLIFQRAIYAKLDNPHRRAAARRSSCCRTGRTGATSRISVTRFVFGADLLAIAIRVFGRSEANFAEEL